MELRNLKTFETICRLGSFSAAAQQLGYAQSSVTAQIKQLERETGCRIFDRIGRTPRLTGKGEILLQYARQVLAQTDTVLARLSDLEPAGPLRIGTLESVGAAFLPEVLARLCQRYPRVEISVATGNQQTLEESLRTGNADLIWLFGDCEPEENLRTLAAFPHELVVVSSAGHPLAGRHISLSRFADENLILGEPTCCYRSRLQKVFAAQGLQPRIFLEVESTEVIRQMVASGLGLGFLPLFLVEPLLAVGRLRVVTVEGLPRIMEGRLLVHKNKGMTPAMQAFAELVRQDEKVARFVMADVVQQKEANDMGISFGQEKIFGTPQDSGF